MKEENNSYIGFALFFFLIAILVAIGSFILYFNKINFNNDQDDTNLEVKLSDKLKENKQEDFIYFTAIENISTQNSLTYKKANINLKSDDAESVNEKLDDMYNKALTSVKKANNEENICNNSSEIYEAAILDYASYSYNKYITLLITENLYNCTDEIEKPSKVTSYTFDTTTGKLISQEDLLKLFNLTYTEALQIIEEHLESLSSTDENNILVDETMNKLKENETYTIFISETNHLAVKYIVKTNSIDYNDTIELN